MTKEIHVETDAFQFFFSHEPRKDPWYQITVKHAGGKNKPLGFGFVDTGFTYEGEHMGKLDISELLGQLEEGAYKISKETQQSYRLHGLEPPTDEERLDELLAHIHNLLILRDTAMFT